MKNILKILLLVIFVSNCARKETNRYTYHEAGYYYRLITFRNDTVEYKGDCIAQLTAAFSTQSDSVFWDSRNNFNDRFYMGLDSLDTYHVLKKVVSKSAEADSIELLIKTNVFFKQQFNTAIPFFSEKDSIVKVNFKINRVFCGEQMKRQTVDLKREEQERIEAYVAETEEKTTAYPNGIYWLGRVPASEPDFKEGEKIKVTYSGSFLNGRFLERSPENFELTVGTPDQLLPGLNYVIGRLKLGQNAKIILPSRLAFGENGSSNGTVPPYTPLIYEVKIEKQGSYP